MSHLTCMGLSGKHNAKSSSNISTYKDQSSSSSHKARVNTVCTKTSAHNSSPSKVKHLKTRKERNRIRGQESNRSHTCPQYSRKVASEKAQHYGCHHSHAVVSSRKVKPFAKPFLLQKPSIITEGRLTSIRGLFSHEVRSVDIERVVSEQLKKEKQRKQSVMHNTSPLPHHPPSMPDSDQDCILNTVQEPLQEPEKTRRGPRKESTRKYPNAIQTNKEPSVSKESSRQDEKHDRSTKTGKENTNNKSRPDYSSSLKGTYELLSSPENKLTLQFCSTPNNPDKYFDFPDIDSLKSHNENNRTDTVNGVMKIQRSESTSVMDGTPNIDVPQSKSNPSSPGMGTLTDNEREKISMSVGEAVNKLAARLELHVPRRPLLADCRDVLLQAIQKTHSFHLQHNLRKLRSYFDGNQADGFGSGQTYEDCSEICFTHALGNEEGEHSRNMDIWTENAIQQEYLADEVKQDPDRGASMKKRRVQAERRFSPAFSLTPPLQVHADMFDQSGTARLSQDCFRTQDYPRTTLFQQDQSFSQFASPIPSTPTWVNPYYEPCSQQLLGDLQRRGESMKNVGLNHISHQWEEKTDPVFKSRFWSNQLQVQDVREQWAPLSSSASFPLEGFRYKPFFRFPHPSNSQNRSVWHGMSFCDRSNTEKVFYHY